MKSNFTKNVRLFIGWRGRVRDIHFFFVLLKTNGIYSSVPGRSLTTIQTDISTEREREYMMIGCHHDVRMNKDNDFTYICIDGENFAPILFHTMQ